MLLHSYGGGGEKIFNSISKLYYNQYQFVQDNMAHDLVRYNIKTMQPYQGMVAIDEDNEFHMLYAPAVDPLILDFVALSGKLGHPPTMNRFLRSSPTLRKVYAGLPLAPNLSTAEYIPTRLLHLLRKLRNYFPQHQLLLSDFSSLPDTIPGVNAPVVQTRINNTTVPCQTLLVKQGYFDIFFPTNFEKLKDMYESIIFQPPGLIGSSKPRVPSEYFTSRERRRELRLGQINVYSNADFFRNCANLNRTQLRNGENPLLDYYQNVKVLF